MLKANLANKNNNEEMESFGHLISVLYRKEQIFIKSVMDEYKLNPSAYKFILILSWNEGANQKMLCDILAIDEAIGTRALKKLEELGYVFRKKEKTDGRAYSLYLSEKGKEIVPDLRSRLDEFWDSMLIDMSDKQIDEAKYCLKNMISKV